MPTCTRSAVSILVAHEGFDNTHMQGSSGGTLQILAASEDPTLMAKSLTPLGWPLRAPPRATFGGLRSTPNGRISNRYPLPSGSAP
jgi:hypothetical protein